MERRFKYLWDRQVIYRRDPITDTPDEETEHYMFYKEGTYQCYDLFRSKAKITSYRSLYWHMLVLWHLNPEWEDKDVIEIVTYLAWKPNGFITFQINKWNISRLVNEISSLDLEEPPRNKLRKIIFKYNCGLDKIQKLSIVGKLIGRLNGVQSNDIYETMLHMNNDGKKITIAGIAKVLSVTPRTIHRRLNKYPALKEEKELLNEETNI